MSVSKAFALSLLGLATAAPLTSRQSAIACPANDGETVGDYVVQCGKDQQSANIAQDHTSSFEACITLASTTSNAQGVAFVKDGDSEGGWCYVKGNWFEPATNENVWGAVIASQYQPIGCPAGDLETIGDYIITCGKDQQSLNIAQDHTANFEACVTLAASTTGAKGVAFVRDHGSNGGWCYVKDEWHSPASNDNVWGAALISAYNDDQATENPDDTDDEGEIEITPVGLTCPDPESPTYTSPATGDIFKIECSIDHAGGDMGLEWAATLDECLDFCAAADGCLDVSYVHGTPKGPCYLKNAVNAASPNGNVWGGLLVTPPVGAPAECAAVISDADALSCPEAVPGMCFQSGSEYFKVECFKDYYGEDLQDGLVWTPTYAECLDSCAETSGCESVAWATPAPGNNGACYRKRRNDQASFYKADVWGASRVASSPLPVQT